jgi:hypothetical protein
MRPLLALGLSALSLVCSPLLASETVSNQQLGVRLSVPDGFVSVPEKVGGGPCLFRKTDLERTNKTCEDKFRHK